MHRFNWIIGVTLIGCGASGVPNVPNAVSTPCPAPVNACPPCAATSAPPISAEPDPETPADTQMANALLAEKPPFSESSPRWSLDGKRVVYVSNKQGKRAVYLRDPTSTVEQPKKIDLPTVFRRPVFSPDGEFVYFTADEKDDEAYAIFRLSLLTGEVQGVITGEKLHRDGPFFLADDPTRFFFTARKPSEKGVQLHAHHAGVSKLVFADRTVELASVKPDGKQALLVDGVHADALSVVDLDFKSKPRHLYPEKGRTVTIWGAVFARDGKRVFAITDDGGDRAQVLALDAKSGKVLARYVESRFPSSQMQELQVAGNRVAVVVDAGTQHEIALLDEKKLEPIKLEPLPVGSSVVAAYHPRRTGGLALSPDGKRVMLSWSTPTSPSRVWMIDEKGTFHRLTPDDTPPFAPTSAPKVTFDTTVVRIPSFDGLAIPTLVHRPKDEMGRGPVLVWMHGAFSAASTARFDPMITTLVRFGFVVVEPNVRGSGGFGRAFELADDGMKKLDAVRDIGEVGRWVAAQPWADATRMVLSGRSAGGYHTLLGLAHDPALWRAGIVIVGVFDLQGMFKSTDGTLLALLEGKELVPASDTMMVSALSPLTYFPRIRAPMLVLAAQNDARSPIEPTLAGVRALRAQGNKVELMVTDGGHGADDDFTRAHLLARMLRFAKM